MVLNSAAGTAGLQQLIAQENAALQAFIEVLKGEQRALSGNDNAELAELPSYAEQKSQQALQLNSLAAQRNALLASESLAPDRSGVERWIEAHPAETNTRDTWSSTLALAAEARELNRLNGELIKIRLQYNSKALEALQGGRHTLDLYGPDGQSTALGTRRINHAV